MYDKNKAHYVVVTGIIIKDGKFLITKRAPTEKAFPNEWTVPRGKLELDDYKKNQRILLHIGIIYLKTFLKGRLWKRPG